MEDLELISLLNECNKMSVFEVSNTKVYRVFCLDDKSRG